MAWPLKALQMTEKIENSRMASEKPENVKTSQGEVELDFEYSEDE